MTILTLNVFFRNGVFRRYELTKKGICLIGRSSSCTLQIPKEVDSEISRHHCLLYTDRGKAKIIDMGSTNGTFINDEKIPSCSFADIPEEQRSHFRFLRNGDSISLGKTVIEIEIIEQLEETLQSSPEASTREIKMSFSAKELGIRKAIPAEEMATSRHKPAFHINNQCFQLN